MVHESTKKKCARCANSMDKQAVPSSEIVRYSKETRKKEENIEET